MMPRPIQKALGLALALVFALPGSATQEQRPLRQNPPEASNQGLAARQGWPERISLDFPEQDRHFDSFMAVYQSAGGQAWLQSVYQRALPYSAYILDRIHHYGVPEELFFLPFIESEFFPKAVSRSGAVGLWQFMLNSIAGYDIHIDEWRDDRRDFMKATDGALRKLLWNYQHFGDWILAIAAYNCGVGALDRAIQRAGGERDFWRLKEAGVLPSETAAYIPKFLAVVATAMHGGRNGLSMQWGPSIIWARLPLDGPIDLGLLAEAIGLPVETLQTGNPELKYNITPPVGNYSLKLPQDYLAPARLAMAQADQLIRVYVHTVQSGDTISALARHYEVSVATIARMNNNLNPDRIQLGQRLIIPALKDKTPYLGLQLIDADHAFEGHYVVQAGDTLWAISQRFGVPVESLAKQNKLSLNAILREGMSLNVPIIEP